MKARSWILMAGAALVIAGAGLVAAQYGRGAIGRPRVTPRQQVDATVDGVHFSIEYGGPFKKGRKIWGGLVPWGRWWMPGADESTTLTTSAPIVLGGLKVPAGDHTIYTLPGPDKFLLIINNELGTFHTHYNAREDLGRVPMTLTMLSTPVEELTFAVEPSPAGGGTLSLRWDDRQYAVSFRGSGLFSTEPGAAGTGLGR